MADVKTGYMHKCGKGVKSWKRRWFVLKPNGYLYYFESASAHTEKGKIDVVDATKVAPWSEVATAEKKLPSGYSTTNTFAIVSGDRTYTCICENDDEHLGWISAIERVRGGNTEPEKQEYPPATYPKDEPEDEPPVETKTAPVLVAPPPYTPSAQPAPPQPAPAIPMPHPGQYGGSLPRAAPPPYQQPQPAPALPRSGTMPAGGPGYQQGYPVGNYRPPPPQANYRPPPPQQYPPRGYAPPPRPAPAPYPRAPPPQQYYKPTGPPPAPYQHRPPQPYYQPRPPQPYYQPRPPPMMQQQQQTNVTIVRL